MRRLWLLLAGLATALVGCSGGTDIPATVTVTVDPDAPETEAAADSSLETSTVAENDIFASQFHPCEVLTIEQLQEAGLGEIHENDSSIGWGAQGCSFYPQDLEATRGMWLVSSDLVDRKHIADQGLITLDWGTEANPMLYVHSMPGAGRQCEAAVDFNWGRLTVDYFETGEGWEPETICSDAVRILDNLLIELGES
ncbi:hypothetical protein CDES_10465 [Corynebacterium deserti GIMN1.010]|uniref:DUF3558 domain-containing protein n=1 Tax=Corynebacterium deserti GIMN1.010 TaxID=931089 RepID=A0A0M3Q9W8_9CORY|nr:DUF3558 family protein [Corynebacterium deserti]ALC06469.1 hypothetical protein CDES_10465 [Corynebacterium deserti GIMN1.010]